MSAKTAKKSLVLSAEEEALVVAFRNLIGASATESDEPDEVEDEEEDGDDEEEVEVEPLDREEVESLGIKELRALAKEYGIDETKKADILTAFEEFYDEDDEDEDEDDEDEEEVEEVEDDDEDEDEDDDDEDGEWDRESLEELDLKDLRKVAKEEGHTVPRGADQDTLIDLILGEDSEDEDEDEDDEDEEVEELDEDALNAMSHKELIGLAKELDVKVPTALKKSTKANQKKLVALILDEGDDE